MKYLSEKNILLISPQPWDHVFISKHHYAEELVKNGNTVFFLQPPSENLSDSIYIKPHRSLDGLFIISWRMFFPRIVRFHFYSLYKLLIALQARKIKKRLGVKLDVVWSFDFNLFPNLRDFGSNLTIFHPVDPLSSQNQIDIGLTADLIISVSEKILNNFSIENFSTKPLLINHGLSQEFEALSLKNNDVSLERNKSISVGYFGNLNREMINLKVWCEIIKKNPTVMFNFWGPYEVNGGFLKAMSIFNNVALHGRKDKTELVEAISKVDCFMLIYSENKVDSDRSNSHKILEYLATGKVIVSSRIDSYINERDLIQMPYNGDDTLLPEIFLDTISNINKFNAQELMASRKKISRLYTYEANLKKIDLKISQNNSFD